MVKRRQIVNIRKNSFELHAWQQGFVVAGIDEVGRGCMAGPVVAATVILPIDKTHPMLKDSKIMTCQARESAALWIREHCIYGVGIIHHRIIDEHNIRQATLMAMKKSLLNALERSCTRPSAILIDAMPLDVSNTYLYDIPIYSFPYGETKSSSIAAASIIAKVTRDAMMRSFDKAIPGYALLQNKGYGTAAHMAEVYKCNHSIAHRVTFLTKLFQQKKNDKSAQQAINFYLQEERLSNEAGEILCRSD